MNESVHELSTAELIRKRLRGIISQTTNRSSTLLLAQIVADPGFPREGGANRKGGDTNLLFCPISSKLYENEKNWTQVGAFLVSLWIRQCQVMLYPDSELSMTLYLEQSIQTHLLHFYVLLSTANQQCNMYFNPMSYYESYLLTA